MMRPRLMLAVAVALAAALAATTSPAQARTTCPSTGLSNTTIRGGLVVGPGYCLLDHVTVHGGVIVEGQVDLESSHVYGGVHLRPGGEIEVGTSIFGGQRTTSTIHGGLHLNHPVDWDIEYAHIFGGVHIRGGVEAFPTLCGDTIHGSLTVRNVNTEQSWIGDPSEDLLGEGGVCPGNTINGSLQLINSATFHVEGNTVTGQTIIRGSHTD